jgi:cbb3-type cytochrome oxidase cytochrome c subunit
MSIVTKFILWSALLFALLAYTFGSAAWNNQNTEKHDYVYWQTKYLQMAADLATDPTVKATTEQTPVDINQVTVLQFSFIQTDGTAQQRVDRCESCHAGLDNPSMTAENIIKEVDGVTVAPAQVPGYLDAHPETLKVVYTLGAHPGKTNGFAKGDLDWAVATATNADPSTAAQQTEYANLTSQHPFATFGCTTCHYGSGRDLQEDKAHGDSDYWLQPLMPSKYIDSACAQCHEHYNLPALELQSKFNIQTAALSDQYNKAKDATTDPVKQVALLAQYKSQYEAISAPFETQITQLLGLKPTDPKASLVSYPASVPGLPVNDATKLFNAEYLPEMTEIERGQELYKENACYGCHKIDGFSKGNVGPELTIEGRIATYHTMEHQLWDPRYKVENCVMPYFFSQKVMTDPDTGEQFYVDKLGKKHPASELVRADITDPNINASLAEHHFVPLKSKEADVTALVTFILAQTGLNYAQDPAGRFARISAYNGADPPTVPVSAEAGRLVFAQSGCYACHYLGDPNNVVDGLGGVAGPNLSWEGSRHSRQWIDAHYVNPQAFVPKSIMPVFPLSDSQRAALSLFDTTFVPKGARQVSPTEDLPSLTLQTDKVMIPRVRYMTTR